MGPGTPAGHIVFRQCEELPHDLCLLPLLRLLGLGTKLENNREYSEKKSYSDQND